MKFVFLFSIVSLIFITHNEFYEQIKNLEAFVSTEFTIKLYVKLVAGLRLG